MQSSDKPGKISVPFADAGAKQPIPVASQQGIEDGRASFTDGFPPLTRTPLAAGGKPPFGTDMNGILNAITEIQQWQSAGGNFGYDSAFSASINGYPQGAMLLSADLTGVWVSAVENNTSNPDAGGAGWNSLSPSGVAGQASELLMSVAAASATASISASEVVLENRLGGIRYGLSSFSKTINLATVGANGMDTGLAPASGYLAIYAIYNPVTGVSALLGVNATSAAAPSVYAGGALPAGFTFSGLLTVVPTNSSRQIAICSVMGRKVYIQPKLIANSTTPVATTTTYAAISASLAIPLNAKNISGFNRIFSSNGTNAAVNIAGGSTGVGAQQVAGSVPGGASTGFVGAFSQVPIITPQTTYWSATLDSGTFVAASINISSYEI